MNFEESRIRTFRNWPSNAPVDARRIAKAGFYYMGQNLEVQCFSCGGRISEWNYNDKVMTRHRSLDPKCPFVLSPALSGNVPITRPSPEIHVNSNSEEHQSISISEEAANPSPGASSEDKMLDEQSRLNTFTNWPISFIVTPESLSKAGFYYVQQGDKVRCAYCSVIIGRWEAGDNPIEEHRRHSPQCSFVQLQLSPSVPDNGNSSGISFRPIAGDCSDTTMRSLGVQSHRVAKHPKYTSKDSRLATYTSWPGDVMQKPDDLAEAGFYYAGSDDQVRCFHCDGGLRKWDPTDDPWVEHARWFPGCGFVLLIKGEKFISDAIDNHPPVLPELSTYNSQKVTRSRQTNNGNRVYPVSEEELEQLMSSPASTAALQIGLDLSRVKMAIRQKLQQTGISFSTADDLIEATLDIQLDEVPYQDSEETWSTPLHSPVRQWPTKVRPIPRRSDRQVSSRESSDSSESEPPVALHQQESESMPDHQEFQKPASSTSLPDITAHNSERKVTLEEENRRLREARLCKICMDNEVCIVFLPCGHLVTCVNCAQSLADCPVCRRTIKATVRTFLS